MGGNICLDILDEHWGPSMTLFGIMISIVSLFDDPGIDEPLVPEIAELYIKEPRQYRENSLLYTQRYAIALHPTREMINNRLLGMSQPQRSGTWGNSGDHRLQSLASLFGGEG